jgi:hypothetical protein
MSTYLAATSPSVLSCVRDSPDLRGATASMSAASSASTPSDNSHHIASDVAASPGGLSDATLGTF